MNVMWYVGKFDEATLEPRRQMGMTSHTSRTRSAAWRRRAAHFVTGAQRCVGDHHQVRFGGPRTQNRSPVRFVPEMYRGDGGSVITWRP
jgi:hypothetical protein